VLKAQAGAASATRAEEETFRLRGVVLVVGGVDFVRVGNTTCNDIVPLIDLNSGAKLTVKIEARVMIGSRIFDLGYPNSII